MLSSRVRKFVSQRNLGSIRRRIAFSFALFIALLTLFQNCSTYEHPNSIPSMGTSATSENDTGTSVPVSIQSPSLSTKTAGTPAIIVNHDLYVHTDYPIESGGLRNSSYISSLGDSTGPLLAQQSILDNQKELTALGAAFGLNATYGSHNLWFWKSTTQSYYSWLQELLGNQSLTYFTSGQGAIDSLIVEKILQRPDFLGQILAKKTIGQPLYISVRMNDHHHLTEADAFLNPSGNLPVTSALFSRRLAALSPDYLNFLKEGKVLSGEETPARGSYSDGLGCEKKNQDGKYSYHLDFADPNVILYKIREIEDLFARYDNIDGVELDFLRSNCFFPAITSPSVKLGRMDLLFRSVVVAKADFEARVGRKVRLSVRLPLDEDVLSKHGIRLSDWAQNAALDAIIFGYSKPYLRSQVTANPVTQKHIGLNVFYELYQITDNQSRRRPATIDEIATSGYEAIMAGYDGLSLFNFHYLFKDNVLMKPDFNAKKFSWSSTIGYLCDREKLKSDMFPSYFFNERNADGDFLTAGVNDRISVSFRFSQADRSLNPSAALRILVESFSPEEKAAWDAVKFNVLINNVLVKSINGSALAPSASTSFGRDPVRYFLEQEVADWGPAGSKQLMIPADMFRNYSNSIQVVPVADPRGFFNRTRRLQLQLTM